MTMTSRFSVRGVAVMSVRSEVQASEGDEQPFCSLRSQPTLSPAYAVDRGWRGAASLPFEPQPLTMAIP